MSKFSVSRLLDNTKALTTDAGKDLQETLSYLAEFVEATARCLRNGLSYQDNFNSETIVVSLADSVATIIRDPRGRGSVSEIRIRRILSAEIFCVSGFGWFYDASGNLKIKASFDPPPTSPVSVSLLVLYG